MRSYEMNSREKGLFYAGIVAGSLFLSYLFYRNIIFAVVIIPFVETIRSYVVAYLMERRRQEYQVQFKDMLFMVSTSIGAGRSMKDALRESIPGLREIHGAKCILARELDCAYERMEVGGENDVAVLMDLAAMSGMDDVVDFVTIYSICKATGASLILALNKAASVIIDKMTIEREIRELVKRKESEGLVIFIMPVLIILFLNLTAPDYIAPLYESFVGRIIMTVVVAANIGIYGLIQKIIQIDI